MTGPHNPGCARQITELVIVAAVAILILAIIYGATG